MATQSRHDCTGAASPARDNDDVDSSAYECNICYDVAREPVVTMCGHLYCWPCLYRYGSSRIAMTIPYVVMASGLAPAQVDASPECV